jgi:hypothetical protein
MTIEPAESAAPSSDAPGRGRARAPIGGSTVTTGDRTSGGMGAVGGVSRGAGPGTILGEADGRTRPTESRASPTRGVPQVRAPVFRAGNVGLISVEPVPPRRDTLT